MNDLKEILSEKNINDYLKKSIHKYPSCKISEYLMIKRADQTKYISPKSKDQIKSVFSNNTNKTDMIYHCRVKSLFSKFIAENEYQHVINDIINANNDIVAYTLLRQHIYNKSSNHTKRKTKRFLCSRTQNHAETIYSIFKNITGDNYKAKKYLDIGCGDCKITKYFGQLLELSNNDIYGADIHSWSNYADNNRAIGINFVSIEKNKPLPLKNKSFDIISALMVLHHVENLMFFLSEINRCLENKGYLLIREHDAFTNTDKMICDIEHGIYDVAFQKNYSFFDEYSANYFDWIEWDIIFEHFGFSRKYFGYDFLNVNQEISPSKQMIMIYQKNETKN